MLKSIETYQRNEIGHQEDEVMSLDVKPPCSRVTPDLPELTNLSPDDSGGIDHHEVLKGHLHGVVDLNTPPQVPNQASILSLRSNQASILVRNAYPILLSSLPSRPLSTTLGSQTLK